MLLRREPSKLNLDTVARAAAARGVALEINCLPDRLDLSDVNARLARERGVKLVISSDAHSRQALTMKRWGVMVARRAWTHQRRCPQHAAVRAVPAIAASAPKPRLAIERRSPRVEKRMSDRLAAIRSLYYGTSKATIEGDFDRAIDLLKTMASEDERDRAAVYMEGLAQMKAQWRPKANRPSRASGAPPFATPPGRSDRSKSAGRRPR